MPFLLLIFFVAIVFLVGISLLAAVGGLLVVLLKFLIPVILIALLLNWLFKDHQSKQNEKTRYERHRSSSARRKELHDVKERDVHDDRKPHQDEWSDF